VKVIGNFKTGRAKTKIIKSAPAEASN